MRPNDFGGITPLNEYELEDEFHEDEHASLLTARPYTGHSTTLADVCFPRATCKSFTFCISLLQICVFALALHAGDKMYDGAFAPENTLMGPSVKTFYAMGAKGEMTSGEMRKASFMRLFTPVLLHSGIIHILCNLFFQLRFGFSLEARWGSKLFALIFFASALGGTLFSCVIAPSTISVGASSALFGVLGANISFLMMNHRRFPLAYEELVLILFVMGLSLLMGLAVLNDNWYNMGGAVVGFLAGAAFLPQHTLNPKRTTPILSRLFLVAFFGLSLYLVYLR